VAKLYVDSRRLRVRVSSPGLDAQEPSIPSPLASMTSSSVMMASAWSVRPLPPSRCVRLGPGQTVRVEAWFMPLRGAAPAWRLTRPPRPCRGLVESIGQRVPPHRPLAMVANGSCRPPTIPTRIVRDGSPVNHSVADVHPHGAAQTVIYMLVKTCFRFAMKLLSFAAVVMCGLFAITGGAPTSMPERAPLAAVTTPGLEVNGSAAACPSYAPKCCAFIAGRCLECVGRFNQCP
jgi:hypothetical protein